MNIDSTLELICEKIPSFSKFIRHVKFEYISTDKFAGTLKKGLEKYLGGYNNIDAFFDESEFKIIYTENLFLNYSDDERAFVIAHEILHYINHQRKSGNKIQNPDFWLINFVEDAQINQLLIKYGLTPPKGLVLLSDALNYELIDLYNKLYPYVKELKKLTNNFDWTKNTSVEDLIQTRSVDYKR